MKNKNFSNNGSLNSGLKIVDKISLKEEMETVKKNSKNKCFIFYFDF